MEEGFIISNKVRKAIFVEIASGETSLTRVIKKHHLIPQAAQYSVKELTEHGLISETETGYVLTDIGAKAYGKLKGSDSL